MFLPAGWNDERMEVLKLKTVQTSIKTSGAAKGQMVTATQRIDIASIDHKQVLGLLKITLENRLGSEQNDLWNFKLGSLLGKISTQMDDDNALRSNLKDLQMLEASAPGDLAKPLGELGAFENKVNFNADDKEQIQALVYRLKTN